MILYTVVCGQEEQTAERRTEETTATLESYAKQSIDHEGKMRTVLQRLEVVEKQRSGKGPFCS
jgi:hypothetical protein